MRTIETNTSTAFVVLILLGSAAVLYFGIGALVWVAKYFWAIV